MPTQRALVCARTPVAAAVAIVLATLCDMSAAQVQRPGDNGVQSMGTVTVTATRRREPVREVPVQLNVMEAEDLEQAGAKNLSEYMAGQPGVEVKSNGGAGLGSVSIRGVTTGEQPSPTVGLYIDDVPFGSSSAFVYGAQTALDMGLMDLKRIEVLRGPQGTLYGAGAMGGLIKYVTTSPDPSELSGKVTLGASNTRYGGAGFSALGVINVPIRKDVAAVRFSVAREQAAGYVDAVGPAAGSDVNRGESTGARASLLFAPDNNLYIRATATAQDISRRGSDYIEYSVATKQPVAGDLKTGLVLPQPYKMKIRMGTLDVEYNMPWARFNSITSVQSTSLTQRNDLTNIYGPLLGSFGLPLSQVFFDRVPKSDKETQEFRLTSNGRGSLEWLAGIFYNHEKGAYSQVINGEMVGGGAAPLLLDAGIPTNFRELAVYGDVTWNFAPAWSLTAGARHARNKQEYAQINDGILLGGPSTVTGSSSESASTYLFTLKYALNPLSNLYFRAASGYRPGGPNALIPDPVTGAPLLPPTFRHDSLWTYEVGYKADMMDRKLAVEASLYDTEWKDVQQTFAINGIGALINAGDARIRGAELALHYKPDSKLSVDLSMTALDAYLVSAAAGLGPAGTRLPGSAHFSAALGATYRFDFAGHPSYAGFNASYVGARMSGFAGSPSFPAYEMPGYVLTNLRAGTQWGRTDIALYVRNLFDKRAQLSAATGFVPLGAPALVAVERPRTIGITATTSF